MNHWKSIKCICQKSFVGNFCEYRQTDNQFLLVHKNNTFLFDSSGIFLDETQSIIDHNVQVDTSCTILINGEALIFGGIDAFKRQVIIHACLTLLWIFRLIR